MPATDLQQAEPVSIDSILARVRATLPAEDLRPLREAYLFAEQCYSGKHRLSGLPYLHHALMVTDILAFMRLDVATLCAGLLHGVLKRADDAKAAEKMLREKFGEDVAAIVRGATKITGVQFNSRLAYQAENIRKMLLAMSADIRVLLVKLADRLHDMQSLREMPRDNQIEFARETMDIYAPLASRLGIDWLKRELEDLSFACLNPEKYEELAGKIRTSLADREAYVDEVKALITKKLIEHRLRDFQVLGRPKHIYSIYKKLVVQNIPLEKVYDKVAFRIIVRTVGECYEALGVIHSLWLPVDGRFKDFISSPKSNLYQSLHTSVVGLHGEFMEVQIRTEEMDHIAKEGIAAHWAYKEGKSITSRDAKLFKWLKQLVQTLQELEDPREFLDAVKGELYEAEIFVLTPNGEVKELPVGSIPIDFAYSIHTEVGNRCTGARINGQISPLRTPLKNGDQVEIITSAKQQPNRAWLSMVKTARAKSRIRQWLNQAEKEKALQVGRELCERELRRHNISLKKIIKTGHLRELLKALACNSLDELMVRVGAGNLPVQAIIKELQPAEVQQALAEETSQEILPARTKSRADKENVILVDGADEVLTKISHCCTPVPGDEILGFITSGRGISVHKASCPNLLTADPQRLIAVSWAENIRTTHRAQIQVIVQDKKGLLATLSNAISTDDANILGLEATTSKDGLGRINIVLEITGREHLLRLLQHLQQLDGVLEAKRI